MDLTGNWRGGGGGVIHMGPQFRDSPHVCFSGQLYLTWYPCYNFFCFIATWTCGAMTGLRLGLGSVALSSTPHVCTFSQPCPCKRLYLYSAHASMLYLAHAFKDNKLIIIYTCKCSHSESATIVFGYSKINLATRILVQCFSLLGKALVPCHCIGIMAHWYPTVGTLYI